MADQMKPEEVAQALEDAVGRAAAGAVYGFVRVAVDAGMTPVRALSVAAFAIIEGTLGREPIRELGLPRQTAAGWRREIAALANEPTVVERLDDLDYEVETLNEILPLMGLRDLRMTRVTPDE